MKTILFSTPMVQAILEGRKTQTRRVAKNLIESLFVDYFEPVEGWGFKAYMTGGRASETPIIYPRYKPGDTLWVQETWRERYGMSYAFLNGCWQPIDDIREIAYKTGGSGFFKGALILCPIEDIKIKWGEWSKWKSPISMPQEAARLFLEVKNVRLERLQEITEKDARAEGCITFQDKLDGGELLRGVTEFDLTARDAYADLWDSINGKKHPWASNPYVWVYEFMRRERQ